MAKPVYTRLRSFNFRIFRLFFVHHSDSKCSLCQSFGLGFMRLTLRKQRLAKLQAAGKGFHRVPWNCLKSVLYSRVANKSIAIDRSIAERQLVDRAWFCIELTRYLKGALFNQYSRKYLHKNYPSIWLVTYILWCLLRLLTIGLQGRCRESVVIFSYYCVAFMI